MISAIYQNPRGALYQRLSLVRRRKKKKKKEEVVKESGSSRILPYLSFFFCELAIGASLGLEGKNMSNLSDAAAEAITGHGDDDVETLDGEFYSFPCRYASFFHIWHQMFAAFAIIVTSNITRMASQEICELQIGLLSSFAHLLNVS